MRFWSVFVLTIAALSGSLSKAQTESTGNWMKDSPALIKTMQELEVDYYFCRFEGHILGSDDSFTQASPYGSFWAGVFASSVADAKLRYLNSLKFRNTTAHLGGLGVAVKSGDGDGQLRTARGVRNVKDGDIVIVDKPLECVIQKRR